MASHLPHAAEKPSGSKWPKILPQLSPEQQRVSDAFVRQWHVELAGPARYTAAEKFNHQFPVRHSRPGFRTTLELGAGLGEHLHHEILTPEQEAVVSQRISARTWLRKSEPTTYFPLPFLPFVMPNLVMGLSLRPRQEPLSPPGR